jgi:hypothetical protein
MPLLLLFPGARRRRGVRGPKVTGTKKGPKARSVKGKNKNKNRALQKGVTKNPELGGDNEDTKGPYRHRLEASVQFFNLQYYPWDSVLISISNWHGIPVFS